MLQANGTRAEETERDWVRAHEALSRLARERAAADAEEGRCFLVALRSAAHAHLGFGSFNEYIERMFGYKPRSTQEKLRVAEALEELPGLTRALTSGALAWSAVRELTRVAVSDNEHDWLELARGKTVRQLEELVAGKKLGDSPFASNRPAASRHVLRFDVAPETFALVREAIRCLRRRSSDPLDDDAALLSMARHVLGEHREDGRGSYQISLTVCTAYGAGQQQAGGELVPIGEAIVAMAHCDGQHLGPITPLAANENALPVHPNGGEAPPGNEELSAEDRVGDASTNDIRKAEGAHVDAIAENADAGMHGSGRGEASRSVARAPKASQTIPPALRRAVLVRDGHCCRVPGCKKLDVSRSSSHRAALGGGGAMFSKISLPCAELITERSIVGRYSSRETPVVGCASNIAMAPRTASHRRSGGSTPRPRPSRRSGAWASKRPRFELCSQSYGRTTTFET